MKGKTMNERFVKQLTREVETRRADLAALEAALAVLISEVPISDQLEQQAKRATAEIEVAIKPKHHKPSPCDVCDFVAVNAQGLGIHKRSRHGIQGKGIDARPLRASEVARLDAERVATTQARRWEGPNTVDGHTVAMT